ncbi:hypothetical protein [Wolbachia endosymbiont (group A) of Ennomos erosarius]|uniref:hypothetical protein n=1 Tax=Wolbachia endosymbiont (group A) of Ennomos erosarius TaxID=3066174 RepID=UPI003342536C
MSTLPNPKSLKIEERIEDSRIEKCYTNNYKIDNGTLSLDERELVFNITPGKWNGSKEFNVISIKKSVSRNCGLIGVGALSTPTSTSIT